MPVLSGIPETVPISATNRQCSSGLQACMNIAGNPNTVVHCLPMTAISLSYESLASVDIFKLLLAPAISPMAILMQNGCEIILLLQSRARVPATKLRTIL